MATNTDWEAIEREYRAGQLSVSEIGRRFGVSHTAVNKRAKAEGWTRDLAKRVRQEVSARLVSSEVSGVNAREAVETAAARGVEIVRQHRGSLGRAHRLAERLMQELEDGTENQDQIEADILAATMNDRSANRRTAMLKAVSLPSRASTLRELSQVLKNLIPMERQAFSLDDPGADEPATKHDVQSVLTRLDASQRDNLRSIAEALAGEPGGSPQRA